MYWWVSLADMQSTVSPKLADSLRAYAACQADVQRHRAAQVCSQHHAALDADSTGSGRQPLWYVSRTADYLQPINETITVQRNVSYLYSNRALGADTGRHATRTGKNRRVQAALA